MYRLDEDFVYLSPVYVRTLDPGLGKDQPRGDALYVADDPTATAMSDRMVKAIAGHVNDLARSRANVAVSLLVEQPDVLIYADTAIRVLSEIQSNDQMQMETLLREAYAALDQRLASVVRAAGPDTTVVTIGLEPEESRASDPAAAVGWVAASASLRGLHSSQEVEVAALGRALAYLFEVSTGSSCARSPEARSTTATDRPLAPQAAHQHLDPGTLARLGVVSNSGTAVPAKEGTEARSPEEATARVAQ
jgi:hypothetical protein